MDSSLIKKIFKAENLNRIFNEQGFVIVNFLSLKEILYLKNFFGRQNEEFNNAFTTFASDNYEYKKLVDAEIKQVTNKHFSEFFLSHNPFWGNFFTKHPNSPAMPLHADLQYVNEREDISINVWCPLVDTNSENGALGIIPHSHKIVNQIRGLNLPRFYSKEANKIQEKFGIIIPLKAGEAIIYDHRLLHFSTPNTSNESRLAITMIGLPKNKQIIHYVADFEGDAISKYNINSVEDFLKIKFKEKPSHLKPIEHPVIAQFKNLTIEDFIVIKDEIETTEFNLSIPE